MGNFSELCELHQGPFHGLYHFLMSYCIHDLLSGGSSWQRKDKTKWPQGIFSIFSLSCMLWDGSHKCNVTSFSWSKVEQNNRAHHCTWMQGLLTRISALELVWKNGGGHGDASWPHGEMQWALRKADIWRWNSGYKCGQETVEEVVFYPSVPRSWYKISPGLWMK